MIGLNAVIHGPSGTGKSWLGDTTPAPRLILDAEGGSRFTPSQPKVVWADLSGPPPETESTCIVFIRTYQELEQVYNWLVSGQHPFNSVVLDQLTEIQMRMIAHFNGTAALQQGDWGTLLRHMDDLVRKFRDLVIHPTRPLQAVLFNAATEYSDGKWKPMLQGAMRKRLPYYVDLVGYMYLELSETTGQVERKLLINPIGEFEAKDRTHKLGTTYGPIITTPHIGQMVEVLNG